MKGILFAVLAAAALTALLLWLVLDAETIADATQLRITVVFFSLVAIAIVAGAYAGFYGRRVYYAIMANATTLAAMAGQLREMIAQAQAILDNNRVAWQRYEAAAADAEQTRLRFLERKALSRPPDDLGSSEGPDE